MAHPQERTEHPNAAGYILSFTLADIIVSKNTLYHTTLII